MVNNLQHNLLTYIGYAARGKFSYKQCSTDLLRLGTKHEVTTLRKEFSLLKKEGLIDFKLHYRKPYPVLSSKGKLEIKTRLAFKKFGDWDQKWRVVLFELPQDEHNDRLKLVLELKRLGFAPLQRSAFISPYPLLNIMAKYATNMGIRQHLSLLTVEKMDEERRIEKAWPLKNINCQYDAFIKKVARIQRHERLWPLQAKCLEQDFAEIFELDPHLPKELLPHDWLGQTAYEIFKEISNSY